MTIYDDRTQLEVLDRATCAELLASQHVGRIAFVSEGEITILPVNYAYDDGRVVLRTADGSKFAASAQDRKVAFEIDGLEPEEHRGWSVVVHGTMSTVTDAEEVERLSGLGLRPWARAPKEHWVAITARRTSGRRILTMLEENRVGPYERIRLPTGPPGRPIPPPG